MDGREVQRLRLAERTAAELKTQNTYLSAQVLQMQAAIDQAKRAAAIDRLLTASLLSRFGASAEDAESWTVELEIPLVDDVRVGMSTLPGMHIDTQKDLERGIWVISLRKNPADVPIIHGCSACGRDHIDPPRREPTDEEKANGVLWVAMCPEKGAEVFAAVAETEKPKIELVKSSIEVVSR